MDGQHHDNDDNEVERIQHQLSQIHRMQSVSLQNKQQEVDQLQQLVRSMAEQLQQKENEIRLLESERYHRREQEGGSSMVPPNSDSVGNIAVHADDTYRTTINNSGAGNPYQDHNHSHQSQHDLAAWLTSWISPSTAARMRKRSTITRPRQPLSPLSSSQHHQFHHVRTVDLFNGFIIIAVIFHFWHYLTLLTNDATTIQQLKLQQQQFQQAVAAQQEEQKYLRDNNMYQPQRTSTFNDDYYGNGDEWNYQNAVDFYSSSKSQSQQHQEQAYKPPPQPIKPWDSTPPEPMKLFDTKNPAIYQRHQCIQYIRQRHDELLLPLFSYDPKSSSSSSSGNGGGGNNQEEVEPVLLVDPAYHANVGDHMLTLGEIEFLEHPLRSYVNNKLNKELPPPVQCHYVQAGGFYPSCTGVISSSDATNPNKFALWHAGGNWGDLWRDAQDVRIPSFRTLLQFNYTIIGMPQSLYYSNKELQYEDSLTIKTNIGLGLGLVKEVLPNGDDEDSVFDTTSQSSRVNTTVLDQPYGRNLSRSKTIFTWREKESSDLAQELYPFVTNLFVPDIAFQLGPFQPIRKNRFPDQLVDILILLRADHESNVDKQRNDEYIENVLKQLQESKKSDQKITFRVVDWPDRLDIFSSRDYFFTTTSIELLSLGKIVVCDRLHAAILSYLVGLPFVYIDQVSGKITKTFSVAFNNTANSAVGSNNNGTKEKSSPPVVDCMDGEKAMWAKEQSLEPALAKAVEFIDRYKLNHKDGGGDEGAFSSLRSFFSR